MEFVYNIDDYERQNHQEFKDQLINWLLILNREMNYIFVFRINPRSSKNFFGVS